MEETERAILTKYLWDVDLQKLDLQASYFFVIERLLTHGQMQEIKVAARFYGWEKIQAVVEKSRRLDAKTVTLWQNFFDLPDKKILNKDKPFLAKQYYLG